MQALVSLLHRSRLALSVLLCCLHALPANAADDALAAQRELYLQAQSALAAADEARYRELLPQLSDYPLLPYLEFAELAPRLDQLAATDPSSTAVAGFIERNDGNHLGRRLRREWVAALADETQWSEVLRWHDPANTTTELSCLYLRARLENGDTDSLAAATNLWTAPRSQPNACDPVFAAWMDAGLLTADIVWERLSASIRARETALARYVARQMPGAPQQAMAQLFLDADARPELLRETARFADDTPWMREIILHGLQRLALVDARAAMESWEAHAAAHAFSETESVAVQRYILLRLMLQDHVEEAEARLMLAPPLMSDTLGEWLLRDALKTQDWPRFERWLAQMPEDLRSTERWLYWQARAYERKNTVEDEARARNIYETLAKARSFYGFLAADILGQDYALIDLPVPATQEQMQTLAALPALVRARELWLAGDEVNARLEWRDATATMKQEELFAVGRLVNGWGWVSQSIQAMIQSGHRDDLNLRFPLAHAEFVERAAAERALTPQFVYAIVRQESAFIQDARSSAGAMGLMQLMPATAQELASRDGMRFARSDLNEPDVNIRLGSRFLAQMLERFEGNRILAAAAYNAGPARVRRWLDAGSGSLPFDIWIETIPFSETRGYVQNVLAYAVIYGYRMGQPVSLVSEAEARATF